MCSLLTLFYFRQCGMDVLGVDTGGTFTDFVLLRAGQFVVYKVLSTPDDPARALLAGVAVLGVPRVLVHGTTVATNALLERRGAATALITTAGFRDVLVIGRGDRPVLYDLDVRRLPPLVPDHWRLEVSGRVDYRGAILSALDSAQLEEVVIALAAQPVEAVAVCLLHAYANPAHEQEVVDALERVAGGRRFCVSASHRVLPEPREFERTSTTVVNAYVAPVLDRYLERLDGVLVAQGVGSLRIMASDGGRMGLATARELPARATLSGPAGGVVGARFIAARAGFERIISFDMGGTSTDVALCDGGLPQTSESCVGGLPVRLPSLDIHTVGAGGGSIARIDAGGALRVGPLSAGADPGPACYGRGELPTVTDANLLLGRLQDGYFLGGQMSLIQERAQAAFVSIGAALGRSGVPLPIVEAALGVVRVVNAAMERAIRTISVERGEDPRDCTLVAFGGAGPLHAVYVAEALGIRCVLVPRFPGVLSALGMLVADVTRDACETLLLPLEALAGDDLLCRMRVLASDGLDALVADGEPAAQVQIDFALDLRYQGQSYEIRTPLMRWGAYGAAQPAPTSADIAALVQRFHELHKRRYGHAMPERPIEVVLLRMRAISVRPAFVYDPAAALPPRVHPFAPCARVSAALEGESPQVTLVDLYRREDLYPGDYFQGPALVVQLDATTVVPPGWGALVEQELGLVLTPLGEQERYQSSRKASATLPTQKRTGT